MSYLDRYPPVAGHPFEAYLDIARKAIRDGLAEANRLHDFEAAKEWQAILDGFDTDSSDLRGLIEEANAPADFDDWGTRADYARDMSMDSNVPAIGGAL